jgi:hypothetical protein
MSLSLNEIKKRAIEFAKEWEDAENEDAEAKPFWGAFLMFSEYRCAGLPILRKRLRNTGINRDL